MPLTAAFATCVQLGAECIEKIYGIGGELELLITLSDDQALGKSGRAYLDGIARSHGVPLLKVANINDQAVTDALVAQEIDWLFIVGWSQIARNYVLQAPKRGCIGMHPTLLPIGRGRASIPWAILKGLDETGVTMFKIDEGVDTGDIIGQESIALGPQVTATELYRRTAEVHSRLIERHWGDIVNDRVVLRRQDETCASVWPGRRPEDGEILPSMTMTEADRLVRAVCRPYPGAFFANESGVVRVWKAETNAEAGTLRLADGFLTPIEFELEQG